MPLQVKTSWKGELPPEIQGKWKAALKEVVMMGEISFRRAVKPAGSEGNPEMIAYHDSSKVGSGCCMYLRYNVKSGYKSILLVAKARLSIYISALRNELCGLLIVVKLITAVL